MRGGGGAFFEGRGSGMLTQGLDAETLMPTTQLSLAEVARCVAHAQALDYALAKCPITVSGNVTEAEWLAAANQSVLNEELQDLPGVVDQVEFSVNVSDARIYAFVALGMTFVFAFIHWCIYCRELDYSSGKYILWQWRMMRSHWFRLYMVFLTFFAIVMFLIGIYFAFRHGHGLLWAFQTVGFQFIVLFKQFNIWVFPQQVHEDMQNEQEFERIVFTRGMKGIIKNNTSFSLALDHAIMRNEHGDATGLEQLLGDHVKRFTRWLKHMDYEELGSGEDGNEEEESDDDRKCC